MNALGPDIRHPLDYAIESGRAQHLEPLLRAVRDGGCAFLMVTQHAGAFPMPPKRRPSILVIGDDLNEALGPAAFHAPSLRRYVRSCGYAVVVSCEPLPHAYLAAAAFAITQRRNVVLVETRPEREIEWVRLLQETKPGLPILLAIVKGGSA